ncbi:MAG: hypothetical protein V3W32_11295 [Gemmatimonadota bacterium]
MKKRVRMLDVIIGHLREGEDGQMWEACYLPGEEADLSEEELARLHGKVRYEIIELVGAPMSLEGEIAKCGTKEKPGCGNLWRRSPKLKAIRVCADCAMQQHGNTAAHRKHLRMMP